MALPAWLASERTADGERALSHAIERLSIDYIVDCPDHDTLMAITVMELARRTVVAGTLLDYRKWMDPRVVAQHPQTEACPDLECYICGVRDCPHGEPLHYHHDGCPACYQADNQAAHWEPLS